MLILVLLCTSGAAHLIAPMLPLWSALADPVCGPSPPQCAVRGSFPLCTIAEGGLQLNMDLGGSAHIVVQ